MCHCCGHRVSTFTAFGRSRLLARWPGTLSRILSGIQRAAQTVLGVCLKRTCSRVTSASSALGVLNDHALSTYSLTPQLVDHALTDSCIAIGCNLVQPRRKKMNMFISGRSNTAVASQLHHSRSHSVNTKSHDAAWRCTVVAVTVMSQSHHTTRPMTTPLTG